MGRGEWGEVVEGRGERKLMEAVTVGRAPAAPGRGQGFALGGCETEPAQTLLVITWNTLAKQIHESEVVLCVAVAALSGPPVPLDSPNEILRASPVAGGIESTQVPLRIYRASQNAVTDSVMVCAPARRMRMGVRGNRGQPEPSRQRTA
jgi:hypothetical protein